MKNNMTPAALALALANASPMALPAVSMQTVATVGTAATTLVLVAIPEEAKAASCPAGPCEPPAPPPPPPPVAPPVTPPTTGAPNVTVPVTVTSHPVTQVGVSTSVATEVNAAGGAGGIGQGGAGGNGGNATGGNSTSTATGGSADNTNTVGGNNSTYNSEYQRQAPMAYAPTVIAPSTVGRCHESSGGPSGGISTPFGGISFGGRARATINGACETHVQSLENRADARVAANSIDGTDAWAACLARVDAMRANPIIRKETADRAEASCANAMNAAATSAPQPQAVVSPAQPQSYVGQQPAVQAAPQRRGM